MNAFKLTDYGQVDEGDLIIIKHSGGLEPKRVDAVLNRGTDKEEILLKSNNKAYFITKNVLTNASWVKSALVVKDEY
jgi:hypothetical protein